MEQLGLQRHIYIENLSSVEISAKDIRHRICGLHLEEPQASVPEKYDRSNGDGRLNFSNASFSEAQLNVEDPG